MITISSFKWRPKTKLSVMLSSEGDSFDLRIKEQILPCRLLAKGNLRRNEDLMKNYQRELDDGKWPQPAKDSPCCSQGICCCQGKHFLCLGCSPVMNSTKISW